MDLLFSRYASPFEFMRPYIEQGRFGEFVTEIIKAENKRRKEQAEKEDEEMLWSAYIHSYSEKSFVDWKSEVLKPVSSSSTGKKDDDMTKADIDNLMKRLFKEETPGQNATT
jgi:hypothetical protein